jgi:hypothetical protein
MLRLMQLVLLDRWSDVYDRDEFDAEGFLLQRGGYTVGT